MAYNALDSLAKSARGQCKTTVVVHVTDVLLVLDLVDVRAAEIRLLRGQAAKADNARLSASLTDVRRALAAKSPEPLALPVCANCGHDVFKRGSDWRCNEGCRCMMSGCAVDRSGDR